MRGKHSQSALSRLTARITPAYAGKTRDNPEKRQRSGDHPRVCGENAKTSEESYGFTGSPPRMRGKQICAVAGNRADGITPAYAGKTAS